MKPQSTPQANVKKISTPNFPLSPGSIPGTYFSNNTLEGGNVFNPAYRPSMNNGPMGGTGGTPNPIPTMTGNPNIHVSVFANNPNLQQNPAYDPDDSIIIRPSNPSVGLLNTLKKTFAKNSPVPPGYVKPPVIPPNLPLGGVKYKNGTTLMPRYPGTNQPPYITVPTEKPTKNNPFPLINDPYHTQQQKDFYTNMVKSDPNIYEKLKPRYGAGGTFIPVPDPKKPKQNTRVSATT